MLHNVDERKLQLLEERMGLPMKSQSPGAVSAGEQSPADVSAGGRFSSPSAARASESLNVERQQQQEQTRENHSSSQSQVPKTDSQESTTVALSETTVENYNTNSNSSNNSNSANAWKKRVSSFRLEEDNNSREIVKSSSVDGADEGAAESKEFSQPNESSPFKYQKVNGGKVEVSQSPENNLSREPQSKKSTIVSYFSKGGVGTGSQIHDAMNSSKSAKVTAEVQAMSAGATGSGNSASASTVIADATKESGNSSSTSSDKKPIEKSNRATQKTPDPPSVFTSVADQRRFSDMEQRLQRADAEMQIVSDERKRFQEQNAKLRKSLEDVYRKMAQQDQRRRRDRLAADCVRVGKLVTQRTGPTSVAEIWEEGYAAKDLNRRSADLLLRKEEIEKRRKRLTTEKKKRKNADSAENFDSADIDASELEIIAEENAIRSHSEELRKDGEALAEEKRLLEAEKAAHLKEIRRCQSEDHSRFARDLPCLNQRYLLTSLLGRGGFSEVWKAYDLFELRDVAVKVHQLNNSWNDERKQSYIKHVTREYTIHRNMQHPRVVSLYDVFEIDVNSFATVLEYCRGTDLDERLKRCKTLPEKDAKTILLQILSGLKYLHHPSSFDSFEAGSTSSSSRKSIIHYDLKPANILFDEMGDSKITDFGLSKIIDASSEGTSVELTSQGAGTYWYLPPECFDDNPRISTKVDVWSVGVILYQMLFGKKPFGEGRSQERILSEGIIRNVSQVEIPDQPKVSEEAKDFVRICLTPNPNLRPDVNELCGHAYIRPA